MFHSLRFRFALICIGLAVGPLIIVGAVIEARSYNTLEHQSLILQRKVAESVGSEIRGIIGQWENELVLLDEVYGLGALELKEQRVILSSTLVHQRSFQEVALLNSEGQEQIRLSRTSVIPDDDLQSRAGNEEFLFPATSGGTYLGSVYFDDTIREPLATISVPVFNRSSGKLVSVLVAESRFKAIWDLLNDLELASEEEVYVIDQAGLVVAHRHPAAVLSRTTIELPEVDGRAEGLSGTDVIVARHNLQLGNQELIVVAEQSVSSALELANKNLGVMVSVVFSALALALILTVYATRRIVRPIEVLAISVQAISGGDFSQQVEVSSRDEVGQLASAFNQMTSYLAESRKEIEQYTLELKANNKQLQREITERKRVEEELASTVEGMLEAIAIIGFDGTIRQVNSEFERGSGWKREELVGKTISELGLMSEEEGQNIEKKVMPKLMKEGFVRNIETISTRRDGTTFPALMSWTLKKDAEGKPTGIITVATDITEYKRIQEALQKAHDELEMRVQERTKELAKANKELQAEITERKRAEEQIRVSLREKEMLLKEIHHRVKNNLQVISSLIYLQSKNVKDVETLKMLEDSRNRIRSMSLIHERLYQSKDLAGIEFGEYVRNLADYLLRSYGSSGNGIKLNTNIDDVFLGIDTAIPCGLIINELISNSLKHAFPDGRQGEIHVELRADDGDRLTMTVSDNGVGFPQDVDYHKTQSLGLQLVNTLVTQLEGTIELDRSCGTALKIAFTKTKYERRD